MARRPKIIVPGVEGELRLGQAAVVYGIRGFPPRAIHGLLNGRMTAGSIRVTLARARACGEPVPIFDWQGVVAGKRAKREAAKKT